MFASKLQELEKLRGIWRMQRQFEKEFLRVTPLDFRTFVLAAAIIARRPEQATRRELRVGPSVREGLDRSLLLRLANYSQSVYQHRDSKDHRYLRPVYRLIMDHENRQVVLAVRGTKSVLDVVTDLTLAPCQISEQFHAHLGMFEAAKTIVTECHGLYKVPKGYQLFLTGHSLAGGVCALASYLLTSRGVANRCVTFGPAACMNRALAESVMPFTLSLVNGSDCVPCLTYQGLRNLALEVDAIDWEKELTELVSMVNLEWLPPDVAALGQRQVANLKKNIPSRRIGSSSPMREPEALFPPGQTVQIGQDGSFVERPLEYWQRIDLSPRLFEDHFMRSYLKVLLTLET